MTRVLYTQVDFWPEAVAAVARHVPHAEAVVISSRDWRGYWEALAARWGQGEALMLVEQDVILHERAFPELDACPQDWCLFPYPHPGAGGPLATGLGCTRFSAAFQQQVRLADVAGIDGNCIRCDGAPDKYKCWAHLDGRIFQAAQQAGLSPHVHGPAVGHRDVPPEGEN
jgi:hypothetical protein